MTKDKTKDESKNESKEKEENLYSIIVYNDEVNTFEHVIGCLIKYCKHELTQAEQCTMIIHNNGKCDVKKGTFKELETPYYALLDSGLSAEIEN